MPDRPGGLVVWGGGSPAPARERQREGADVVCWPGAPASSLEREGFPFRAVEDVLGPEGLAATDSAVRTWARVWGRLPLVDGKSFRELVEWRGASLLWCAEAFLRNETAGGSWLTVVCEDPRGGIAPIGTRVTVRAGGRTQWRDIAAGDSFMSTHDPRPHFGLGTATKADEVDVRWPDGTHTVLRDVAVRQFLKVRKGNGSGRRRG